MKIAKHDLNDKVLIVAEIGNNHEGSFERAKEMVHLVKESGADAVKFQTFKTELFINPANQERFKRLKGFELSFDNFAELAELSKKLGLIFISTPLDLESAKFLNTVVDAFKVASSDNTFYPLLEYVAGTSKPVIISTGLSTSQKLKKPCELIKRIWDEKAVKHKLIALHCVTAYPTAPEDANVAAMDELRRELNCIIGYSDHTLGIEACLVAVARGARLIEKHFTSDKNLSAFRDHQLSSDKAEMSELVERIRKIELLLGHGRKEPSKSELENLEAVRRSIVVKRTMQAAETIKFSDLSWTRPSGGLTPGQEALIIGRTLKRKILEGEMIALEDLE